jgi:hypothetical protein
MMWFGPSWGAPICNPHTKQKTPSGHCIECQGHIRLSDQGFIVPFTAQKGDGHIAHLVYYHKKCFLELILPPPSETT